MGGPLYATSGGDNAGQDRKSPLRSSGAAAAWDGGGGGMYTPGRGPSASVAEKRSHSWERGDAYSMSTSAASAIGMLVDATKQVRKMIQGHKAGAAKGELPFAEVPAELCAPDGGARALRLRAWSLLVTDATLAAVAAREAARLGALAVELTAAQVAEHMAQAGLPRPLLSHAVAAAPGGKLEFAPAAVVAWRERDNLARVREVAHQVALEHCASLHGLTEVDVAGAERITDAGMAALARGCTGLTALDVGGAARVSDAGVRQLAMSCGRLTRLCLAGCTGVIGPGLAVLGQGCRQLEAPPTRAVRAGRTPSDACGSIDTELDLTGTKVASWALARVFEGCPRLARLVLSRCARVCDADLAALALAPCVRGGALRELRLAHCALVTDVGLCAVARACRSLERLDLTRTEVASRVTDVTLMALSACGDLRALRRMSARMAQGQGGAAALLRLDLSGCACVTDVGLDWLGRQAPALQHLDLSGCNKISDTGLASLAERCPQLRPWHTHRDNTAPVPHAAAAAAAATVVRSAPQISNAGLASLAERCPQLSWLALAGLTLVTDTGVSRLAQGACAVRLRHLDLAGIYLLSDGAKRDFAVAGLQALAASCTQLESLVLDGCFRVSTQALRALGARLHALTHLSLARCPAITAQVDGANAHAAADHGVCAMAARCGALTSLDVRDCGAAVTDALLEGVARGCPRLAALTAARAPAWGVRGMRALCRRLCASLERLDVSGCAGLTDDAFVPFKASADFGGIKSALPQALDHPMLRLRSVSLCDCAGVGGVGVQWLAQGCPALVTLNVHGTKVRVSGGSSIRNGCPALVTLNVHRTKADMSPSSCRRRPYKRQRVAATLTTLNIIAEGFPHSAIKLDDRDIYGSIAAAANSSKDSLAAHAAAAAMPFFGLSPFRRWQDRAVITAYHTRRAAADTLRRAYRAHCARRRQRERRRLRCGRWLADCLARLWWQRRRRAGLRARTAQLQSRRAAAVAVQSFWRCACSRGELRRRRASRQEERKAARATEIQRVYRGMRGRRRAAGVAREAAALLRRQHTAALTVQCGYRCYVARGVASARRRRRRALQQRRDAAAARIQRAHRRGHARALLMELRRAYFARRARHIACAKTIQKNFRQRRVRAAADPPWWRCMRVLADRRAQRARRAAAAACLQRHWRGCCGRARFRAAVHAARARRREAATAVVQLTWLRLKASARRRCRELQEERAARGVRRSAAAVVIQRFVRDKRTRRCAALLRLSHIQELMRLARLQQWAAAKLQSVWRGHRGRCAFRVGAAAARKEEHMARWKEMYDAERQVPFYYNQITGEVRWRRPQDLLELMPRPACSNCEAFEAYTECASCGEYFCTGCWDKVHGGGKRRHHQFRALYEYYGKRVDYGDGDFPSMWPSDIEQDDMAGWHRRTATAAEAAANEAPAGWGTGYTPSTGGGEVLALGWQDGAALQQQTSGSMTTWTDSTGYGAADAGAYYYDDGGGAAAAAPAAAQYGAAYDAGSSQQSYAQTVAEPGTYWSG
ncbi:hypothetical protein JKP88DRAFT_309838 [Tribonema minus]|uniref:WW domain-containing protein n=1 Tax=Tribonema minus TaxID=303371 RepID=A0A835ZCL3_9STRA|nr:hypothetical protein JKP88DRAFT_309838 [Tribonema minus]